ncbi:hypothetical protein Aspvir_001723 [Aspergillus viridinutans]|uniref:tripeptidyl-peptidase II n=1 Tax=Aspergillus viridinutans TaxID=75553 RepID=A0A9P3F2H5_ASPVI|nr:uncharacterized protein Aspvir_001723 [Aspergillus viridinutans]GIJ99589.1 hypothetical protein Aspvir_001723 [Aspergillus viridinutans]
MLVNIFYLHSPDRKANLKETLSGVNDLYTRGKFKKFGLSNFLAREVEEVIRVARKNDFVLPSVYQGSYSAVSRMEETPLAGGFLAKTRISSRARGRWDPNSAYGQLNLAIFDKSAVLRGLHAWAAISKKSGISKADLAFRRIVYHSGLDGQRALYNFPANIDAEDQTIGIFRGEGNDENGKSLSNYDPSDLAAYCQHQKPGYRTTPTVVPVALTVGSKHYSNDPSNPTLELSQDIMTVATIAQGRTINVYFSDLTEQRWLTFQLSPISCQGISGDWGANSNVTDGRAHVGWPGSDPWITCVGGTVVGNVMSTESGATTFDEYAWSDRNNKSSQFTIDGTLGVTGGGMSVVFPTPTYQIAAGITGFVDSKSKVWRGGRFIPDIAGMVGLRGFIIGKQFGLLNPTLYQLGDAVCRAITFGHNDSGDTADCAYFSAGVGYDPVTGLGSIDGAKMLNAFKDLYSWQKRGTRADERVLPN